MVDRRAVAFVRLSEEESATIKRAAAHSERSVSAWARLLMLAECERLQRKGVNLSSDASADREVA